MAYRFTNTDKWGDAWFSNLKPNEKLLFIYLYENCDMAGFIELNKKRWCTDIGLSQKIIEGALKGLGRGLIISDTKDCIFLRNYLKHQKNLPLIPEKNPAHRGIIKSFDNYKYKFKIENIDDFIEGACQGLSSPIGNGNGNGNDNGKKEERANFNFSFLEETWKELFFDWIEYKKSIKDNYTTQKSIEACYRNLQTLSRNDLTTARRIIDQSVGNKWKGLFPLKESIVQKDDMKVSTKYIK